MAIKKTARGLCALAILSAALALAAVPARSDTLTDQRVLAQQGFAVGLANFMVVTELSIAEAALFIPPGTCLPYEEGGSFKIVNLTPFGAAAALVHAEFYFDGACVTRYVEARLKGRLKFPGVLALAGTMTVRSANGLPQGTFTVDHSVNFNAGVVRDKTPTYQTGVFAPVKGPSIQLGVACDPAEIGGIGRYRWGCLIGVAQSFQAINTDLASVTTLNMVERVLLGKDRLSISGGKMDIQSGSLGTLGIVQPTPRLLTITGAGVDYGDTSVSGSVENFSLFPGAPVNWTVTGANALFSISMAVDGTYSGTITSQPGSATLATFNLDATGTGRIVYSSGQALVRSWMLMD